MALPFHLLRTLCRWPPSATSACPTPGSPPPHVVKYGENIFTMSCCGELTLTTPGDGGGGGGGGTTVGGHAGGPEQSTSHWLRQDTTFEPCAGPACPAAGQPHPPEPCNQRKSDCIDTDKSRTLVLSRKLYFNLFCIIGLATKFLVLFELSLTSEK